MPQLASTAEAIARRLENAKEATGQNLSTESAFRLGYRPSLDGIRGLFMCVVMAVHAEVPFLTGGFISVDTFFVLSGFLITALLMKERERTGTIKLKEFYMRRALRLFPALLTVLLVCCLYTITQPKEKAIASYKAVFATLFYVANWVQAFSPNEALGPLNHTWSLSLEEQYYLIWPFLLIGMFRLKLERRWIMFVLLIGIAASSIHRAMLWQDESSMPRVYFALDTRADQILIGCMIGMIASWNLLPRSRWALIVANIGAIISMLFLIGVVMTASRYGGYTYKVMLTLVAVATAVIIVDLISSPSSLLLRLFELSALVWIGRLSYGIYLWHYPIFRQFHDFAWHPLIKLLLGVGLTFAVASISFYFIEQPFLRMKTRFTVARKTAP